MLENGIIYTVEVIKYYIIMKYLLGFRVRRSLLLSVFGAVVIGMFSVYVTITENNPMAMFLVYIFIEMFILIKEKVSTIVLSTCWLMIIVGMLDSMFLVVMEFVAYNFEIEHSVLDCTASVITMIFLWGVVYVIKKWTKGETFSITKVYYIYLSALTFAEGVLIAVMKKNLGEEYGIKLFVAILVCTVVMIINIVVVLFLAVSKDGYKQRDEINKRYLKTQEENYVYLKERNEDIRRFRHDMKAHMIVIKELMEGDNKEQLELYINRVEDEIHLNDERISVGNGVVDAVLNKCLYEANKCNVNIEVKGQLFEDCNIEPYDLCIIFDNLLKNAVEAATETLDKKVFLSVDRDERFIQIYIENSCSGDIVKEADEFVTTKKDKENHGYGLKNVKNSVKKYNGTVSFDVQENDRFCVDICIPLIKY